MIEKIVDDALDYDVFRHIQGVILSDEVPWNYSGVLSSDDSGYYTHNVYYNNQPCSPFYGMITSAINPLVSDIKSLLRIRLISFWKTAEIEQFGRHRDYDFEHQGLLLYMNTNNGYTRLKDEDRVLSKENRAFYHDASRLHNSTSCTDSDRRVVLTINYL